MPGLIIADELDRKTSKDSSRYLQAGASRSLFVLATDDQFPFLANWLRSNLTGIVICETGYLGNFIFPSKAFFVEGNPSEKEINWKFPFQRTTFDGNEFHPQISELIKMKYHDTF